jgi:hypothetical protein
MEVRPAPKDKAHSDRLVITKYGGLWADDTGVNNPVAQEFAKLMKAAGIEKRSSVAFYGLRHTARTIMGETACQPPLQIQEGEKPLHDHQPGKRGQGLALELQLGDRLGFTADLLAARLHGVDLLGRWRGLDTAIVTEEVHVSSGIRVNTLIILGGAFVFRDRTMGAFWRGAFHARKTGVTLGENTANVHLSPRRYATGGFIHSNGKRTSGHSCMASLIFRADRGEL